MEARREFLALAEACGARLSGKPDGSEPIEVIFSIEAWRAFDTAQPPAALAGEREAFDESSFDLPPLGVSNPLVGLIAAGGEPAKKIQDYLWECGRAGWSARTIADPTTFLDGKATSWIATCPKCDCSIHFASRPTTQAPQSPLEETLKRAYYYDDAGNWRGSSEDCSEWDRWHAVAKAALATQAPAEPAVDHVECEDCGAYFECHRCGKRNPEVHYAAPPTPVEVPK